jgi:hypothetical protein
MYFLCRNIFCLFFLINLIQGVKIRRNSSKNPKDNQIVQEFDKSPNDAQPVLFDLSGGQLEEQLHKAINENEQQLISLTNNQLYEENEQRLLDMTGGSLEEHLEKAIKDDAHVPSSLDNSLIDQFSKDDFEPLSLSDFDQELKYLKLDKVATDTIPADITTQDYSISDKIKLIKLYQSNKIEDLKELFEFIAQNIHNKYWNCASNFGKWLTNPQLGEPIFYRNCIPCTNTVDLNLQSLFNQEINLNKLKHYFVNTCEMGTQWISYISDMEYLPVDLQRHPTTTFTDVIRQNLIPNQRF